jgi:hypothetical protein
MHWSLKIKFKSCLIRLDEVWTHNPQNTLGCARPPSDQQTFHETKSPNIYLTNIFSDRLKQKKIEASNIWRPSAEALVAHAQNRACWQSLVNLFRWPIFIDCQINFQQIQNLYIFFKSTHPSHETCKN